RPPMGTFQRWRSLERPGTIDRRVYCTPGLQRVCSLRQVLCLDLEMLYQHAFHASRPKVAVPYTEIADTQVAPVVRVRIVGVIEVPGCGIASRTLAIRGDLTGRGPIDGIDFQDEIPATINIEEHWLQTVANSQFQREITHRDSRSAGTAVL